MAWNTPRSFGMIPAKAVSAGRIGEMKIASVDGSVWHPTGLIAVCRTGKRILGQDWYWAEFTYEEAGRWELPELRRDASTAVELDPDDLWDQVEDHDTVVQAICSATTFEELVRAIAEVGGHGS